jgi:hypothetical protein
LKTTRKFARNVEKNTLRRRITIGLAELTPVSTREKCGGAAVKPQKKLMAVK